MKKKGHFGSNTTPPPVPASGTPGTRLMTTLRHKPATAKSLSGDLECTYVDIGGCLAAEPPVRPYLFERLFPQGVVGVVAGTGGTSKSMYNLQLAYSQASGEEVFSAFRPVKPRIVMYFQGEDPADITKRRLYDISRRYPLTPEKRELLEKNLLLRSAPAEPLFAIVDGRVVTTEAYKKIQRDISRTRPGLVILDPLSRWSGLNENSNLRATTVLNLLEDLVKPHGASMLVVHHTTKSGGKSLAATGVRGAAALLDGSRFAIMMAKAGDLDKRNPNRNDILLDIVKNSYGGRLSSPATLRHSDEFNGVLEQAKDYDGLIGFINIAQALADWLAENGPVNVSGLRDPRSEREKRLHEHLENRCGSWRKDMDMVLKVGEDEGLLVVESVGTGGRPAKQIRAVLQETGAKSGRDATVADFAAATTIKRPAA